jgi:GntR family transcriptional regulator of arabinose operon
MKSKSVDNTTRKSKTGKRVPAYIKIADEIQKDVSRRGLKENDRLGSQREFIEEFDVSSITIESALRELQDRGVVYRVQGRGTFVAGPQKTMSPKVVRIGVVGHVHTNWDSNIYARDIFQSIESYARNSGCYVRFIEQESDYARLIDDSEVDGLVIITPSAEALAASGLVPGKHAYVVIGANYGNHPCVTVDNESMTRIALGHLADLGHRDIALLTDPLSSWDIRHRWDAYLKFYAEHKWVIRPEWVLHLDGWLIQGEEEEERVFEHLFGMRKPTAVLAMGAFAASDLIRIVEKRGLSVPEDVSIIGLDLPPFGTPRRDDLTTVLQPTFDIGYRAMQIIGEQISREAESQKVILPCSLRAGNTTRSYEFMKETCK